MSLLNPLTKRLKSENTSLLWSSDLPAAPDPVGGPLKGGDPNTANKLSAAPIGVLTPPSTRGREMRLPAGLVKLELIWVVVVGSISRDDRNEVLSSSFLVLVMVKNESRRLPCSGKGVPFKSKIFWKFENEASPMSRV